MNESETPESNKYPELSDFIRTSNGNSVFVSGACTPDSLTPLRQTHMPYGVAPLSAQMELAWLDGDDDKVKDIALLQDSLKNLSTP